MEKLICHNCQSENVQRRGTDSGKTRIKCKNCNKWSTIGSVVYTEHVKIEEDGNNSSVIFETEEILSIDELLNKFNVDIKVWKVEKQSINRFYKQEKLFHQIKLTLGKIIPDVQKYPIINKLNINPTKFVFKPSKKKDDVKRALVIPDIQTGFLKNIETGKLDPFHDRRCLDLDLKISVKMKPDVIILVGDNLDLAEWSDKFIKKPEFFFTTQAAIVEYGWFLSQLRLLNPSAEIVYLAGNHEYRLEKSIINNMVWSYGLKPFNKLDSDPALSIESLLSLKELKINYIKDYPNGEYWLNDNLKIVHGNIAKSGSGDTVKEVLKQARSSMIQGHIHRIESASKTVHTKDKTISYTASSFGCQCKLDGTVPSFGGRENWQQGLGVVEYQEGNGLFQTYPYSINDGKILFNNEIISSDEKGYLDRLKKDTNWKF